MASRQDSIQNQLAQDSVQLKQLDQQIDLFKLPETSTQTITALQDATQRLNQLIEDTKVQLSPQTHKQGVSQEGHASNQFRMFGFNPLSALVKLILGDYKGKLNAGIDEVLKNAEVTVSTSKGSPTGEFDNTVDINIQVAATLIDEYSTLLKFFIKNEKILKKMTPKEIDALHEAHDEMDEKLSALNRQRLAINTDIAIYKIEQHIDNKINSGCWAMFKKGRLHKLTEVNTWLKAMRAEPSADEHVLAAAVMILKNEINNISNTDDRKVLKKELLNLLKSGDYPHQSEAMAPYLADFATWADKHSPPPLKHYHFPQLEEVKETLTR